MRDKNRRQALIHTGLQILREEGLAGRTQPKVARRARLRQGNRTYYFPIWTDLLAAVAREAIDRQLAAAQLSRNAKTPAQAVAAIAAAVTKHGRYAAQLLWHETKIRAKISRRCWASATTSSPSTASATFIPRRACLCPSCRPNR